MFRPSFHPTTPSPPPPPHHHSKITFPATNLNTVFASAFADAIQRAHKNCQKTNMPSIQWSFYLLNARAICTGCTIFLHNLTRCIDGFSLLLQRHIRKGNNGRQDKVCIRAKRLIRSELIPPSFAWSDWECFYSPLDGMLVHCRVTPSIKFACTHLYTWVERGQELNPNHSVRSRTH